MKKACILTDYNYFKWLIQSHSRGEDVGNVLSSSDFLIMDRNAGQLKEKLSPNIFRLFGGKVLGVAHQVEHFADTGHFNSGQSEFYPEFALGLSEENRMLIQELNFGGIVVEDLNSLSGCLHVSPRIKPGLWLKQHLVAQHTRIYMLEIQDPYLLAADKRLLLEILETAKDKGLKKLKIVYKTRKNGQRDWFMERIQLKKYKEDVERVVGFTPDWNPEDKTWFHDRKIIVDGMVYLIGHSFSIPDDTFTYSIGIDKITYNNGWL
jgi:hypothetical protein